MPLCELVCVLNVCERDRETTVHIYLLSNSSYSYLPHFNQSIHFFNLITMHFFLKVINSFSLFTPLAKIALPFMHVWTNLNSHCPRMLCAQLSFDWSRVLQKKLFFYERFWLFWKRAWPNFSKVESNLFKEASICAKAE